MDNGIGGYLFAEFFSLFIIFHRSRLLSIEPSYVRMNYEGIKNREVLFGIYDIIWKTFEIA